MSSAAPGSGLLLPTLDDLMAAGRGRAGVSAVLDAADRLHQQVADVLPTEDIHL